MTDFFERDDFSVVTLIIPQVKWPHCLEMVQSHWPYNAIQFDCRGTLVRDNWLQTFLPTMNPECEYVQFMVNDADVDEFMAFCVDVNDLHLPGAGAIFSSKCTHLSSNATAVTAYRHRDDHEQNQTSKSFKNNLYAVYALIQSGRTEQAIKAAMQAGSHGPIVYFVEGRGTRDRAGWLKITKKPYEEVVMVLVEDIDRESVIEALVTSGRVGTLGSGVVFDMPIGKGLVNLPTSLGNRRQRSTNEQITAAIDELMGNSDWRNRRSLDALVARVASHNAQDLVQPKSVLLNVFLPRKYANDFLDQVLILGIPGANVTYAKRFSLQDEKNEQGVQIHRELVQVRMVVPASESRHYSQELRAFATQEGYKGITLYEQDLEQVIRYQIKAKETENVRMYRGAKVLED
jgi:nitrogen regulatory protein PII